MNFIAVIGMYADGSNIERVCVVTSQRAALLTMKRWGLEKYTGYVEIWQQDECGTAREVKPSDWNLTAWEEAF